MIRISKNSILCIVIIQIAMFQFFSSVVSAKEEDVKYGELKIQGSYIEKLVLEDKDHQAKEFEKPGEIIKLPVGEYRLLQVHLIGEYSCGFRTSITGSNQIKIEEGKQFEIKAGGPLKQFIETERVGKYLVLNYKLIGIDGENYIKSNLDKVPEFAAYKGNKMVDFGKFEYG